MRRDKANTILKGVMFMESKRERRAKASRKWEEANREKVRNAHREWQRANPDKVREYNLRYWERKLKELDGERSEKDVKS